MWEAEKHQGFAVNSPENVGDIELVPCALGQACEHFRDIAVAACTVG